MPNARGHAWRTRLRKSARPLPLADPVTGT